MEKGPSQGDGEKRGRDRELKKETRNQRKGEGVWVREQWGQSRERKDRRHDRCKDICMHYTFRAKQEGKAPEESQKSNILFGSLFGHLNSLFWNRLFQSCFPLLQNRGEGSGVWLGDFQPLS